MAYIKQQNSERKARLTGLILTFIVHIAAFVFVSFDGIKYIYPPPEEKSVLIDFSEEPSIELEKRVANAEPQSDNPNPDEPVQLAQQSQAPEDLDIQNLTPETKQDDFGDVDTSAIEPEEPKLDPRASFPGMAKKDTTLTAAHQASEVSEKLKAGQVEGNIDIGRRDGRPNAQVKGRKVLNGIPRPDYNVQESGIVVVNIWVDNYGNVVKAVPGGDGTTVLDKSLYAAARKAAMETHFNMSADAPAAQEGTITYYFNLN